MNTKTKLLGAILFAICLPAFALAFGLGFAQDLPTLGDLGLVMTATAPLIAFGGKQITITQAVDQRGKLLQERDQILDNPAETRGEGESAVSELSAEQRSRIDAIDAELRDLDQKIETARERARLAAEQRSLETEARSMDISHVPDPARRRSSGEARSIAQFSLGRALRLASEGRSADQIDGVEGEMLQEGALEARSAGITPAANGFMVASVALSQDPEMRSQLAGTANVGGNLVQTNVGSLLDALFERLVFSRLGADINTGLTGNMQINRMVRGTPPADKGENTAADKTTITFEPVTLSPRRTPTYVDVSNNLFVLGGEGNLERRIVNHVRSELRARMEISYVADILATNGIGDLADAGGNGSKPVYGDLTALYGLITSTNADPDAIQFLMNSLTEAYLMGAPMAVDGSGDAVDSAKIIAPSAMGRVAGRNYEVSNVVPSDLDAGTSTGVCSALLAGDFSGVTIGQWSGLEFLVDPYTQAANGMRRIHSAVFHDSAVNDPAKLAAKQDVLTA